MELRPDRTVDAIENWVWVALDSVPGRIMSKCAETTAHMFRTGLSLAFEVAWYCSWDILRLNCLPCLPLAFLILRNAGSSYSFSLWVFGVLSLLFRYELNSQMVSIWKHCPSCASDDHFSLKMFSLVGLIPSTSCGVGGCKVSQGSYLQTPQRVVPTWGALECNWIIHPSVIVPPLRFLCLLSIPLAHEHLVLVTNIKMETDRAMHLLSFIWYF